MLGGWLPSGALRSLIVDGVLAGVGGVLMFLPQIMVLFLFIAILEDCGYLARACFLADSIHGTLGHERQERDPTAVELRVRGAGASCRRG